MHYGSADRIGQGQSAFMILMNILGTGQKKKSRGGLDHIPIIWIQTTAEHGLHARQK